MAHDMPQDDAPQTGADKGVRETLAPPADWPAGVPYTPVELEFTEEEEAALDAYWEAVAAETAARDAARKASHRRAHAPSASAD